MDIKSATLGMLQQLKDLLLETAVSQYRLPLSALSDASIGQHYRHIIDFYLCVLGNGMVNEISYDNRKRDTDIELDPLYAADIIDRLSDTLNGTDVSRGVLVEQLLDKTSGGIPCRMSSSIGRELLYCYDHAVHHLAIIRIGCNIHFPELSLSDEIGVAPSTLRYRR